MSTLLLGSNSPRRQALLNNLGFSFETCPLDIDESYPIDLPVSEVAAFIAERKLEALLPRLSKDTIGLTADTTVILKNTILQKPADARAAQTMLTCLSGQKHTVNTAVAIHYRGKTYRHSAYAEVVFKTLAPPTIAKYIGMGLCYDKAGGYGIQDWIGMVGVERIEGDYYTILGLPTSWCYEVLNALFCADAESSSG